MRTQHAGEHPSNRLSSGAVRTFEEALELAMAQCAYERVVASRGMPDLEPLGAMAREHAQISAAIGQARRVWQEEQEVARRRTVDRLHADALAAEAALDDEAAGWLGLLATALEQGDYSGLAI